ncbi:MAG: WxL protein host-binding domain-containing protein, partial [Pseudolactococcus laudensis]
NYIVNVRKNDNKDTENIIVEKSEATTLNQKSFIRILLKNDSNAWLNNVLIDSHILDQATKQSESHQFSRIAPNSKIEILIPISEKFKAGTYLTMTSVQTASRTWQLKSQFKLSTSKINLLNGKEQPIHKGKHSKTFYYVSVLFVLLILTIIFQFRFIQKHNRI